MICLLRVALPLGGVRRRRRIFPQCEPITASQSREGKSDIPAARTNHVRGGWIFPQWEGSSRGTRRTNQRIKVYSTPAKSIWLVSPWVEPLLGEWRLLRPLGVRGLPRRTGYQRRRCSRGGEGELRRAEGEFRRAEGEFRRAEGELRCAEGEFGRAEGEFRRAEGEFRRGGEGGPKSGAHRVVGVAGQVQCCLQVVVRHLPNKHAKLRATNPERSRR
eukprot:1194427-Prorocentrum_minimum.AAC.3